MPLIVLSEIIFNFRFLEPDKTYKSPNIYLEEIINAQNQFIVRSDQRVFRILHESDETGQLNFWEFLTEFVRNCNRSIVGPSSSQHVTNECDITFTVTEFSVGPECFLAIIPNSSSENWLKNWFCFGKFSKRKSSFDLPRINLLKCTFEALKELICFFDIGTFIRTTIKEILELLVSENILVYFNTSITLGFDLRYIN